MDPYHMLIEQATANNILTFRDAVKALCNGQCTDGDAYDIYGTEEAEEMLDEELYFCDAAANVLELLAQENII